MYLVKQYQRKYFADARNGFQQMESISIMPSGGSDYVKLQIAEKFIITIEKM